MKSGEIVENLKRKKIKVKNIAKKLKVSDAAVSQVLWRRNRGRKIMLEIADMLGLPVEFVFPEIEEME